LPGSSEGARHAAGEGRQSEFFGGVQDQGEGKRRAAQGQVVDDEMVNKQICGECEEVLEIPVPDDEIGICPNCGAICHGDHHFTVEELEATA
jgi:hypothetical protein